MSIRVLVVDDSPFFCKRIREVLEEDPEFYVVGVAHNGRQAVDLSATLQPDVITMDVNMPIMDGISAVKSIMSSHPCPILMLSAMTQIGAKATLDALQAGAIDFLPKQFKEIDTNHETAKNLLRHRVRMVAAQGGRLNKKCIADSCLDFANKALTNSADKKPASSFEHYHLLVIAASTGGPMAIQYILSQIPKSFAIPVLLLQHMPQSFTKSFAERLNQLSHLHVKEAENGDSLKAGTALLGPGGLQMEIKTHAQQHQIVLRPKQAGEIYSPCIDITFLSLADHFEGQILAVVLTGMGSDGKEGAIKLKQQGAKIWAQDEASSTIYGMPRAIAEAHIADKIYSLDDIANAIKKLH